MLDREGREPGIGDQIASCVGLAAQVAEDRPMARARMNYAAVRLVEKSISERNRIAERVRPGKNALVRGNTYPG
jgi:hypothetical protein